ncbi:hypothetical protein JNW90_04260 [Micromonospora sp. STR1s_5]|nr:hypothetical protein [Micromonospora sp. STR1s_5]
MLAKLPALPLTGAGDAPRRRRIWTPGYSRSHAAKVVIRINVILDTDTDTANR